MKFMYLGVFACACGDSGQVASSAVCPFELDYRRPAGDTSDALWFDVVDVEYVTPPYMQLDSALQVVDLTAAAPVNGVTVWHSSSSATFYPTDALVSGHDYDVVAGLGVEGCAEVGWRFMVGDVAAGPVPVETLAGRAWAFGNIPSTSLVLPADSETFANFVSASPFSIAVTLEADSLAGVVVGGASDGVQDVCVQTGVLATVEFSNPFFRASGVDVPLALFGHVAIPFESLTLSGAFVDGGAAVAGFRLDGYARTDDVAAATSVPTDVDACWLFGGMGMPCQACPISEGVDCVHVIVDDPLVAQAIGVPGLLPVDAPSKECTKGT